VSKRLLPGLAILAVLVLSSVVAAVEPDGRVAFRYDWPDRKNGDAASPRLAVSMTAVTPLKDARLVARIPAGISVALRHGASPAAWPSEGLELGDLPAGKTIVVELDVPRPAKGGGILGLYLEANADGRPVSEGVGVPVGLPGTAPTIRNGAAEFPAARPDPAQ
jgi:hypothetical protein